MFSKGEIRSHGTQENKDWLCVILFIYFSCFRLLAPESVALSVELVCGGGERDIGREQERANALIIRSHSPLSNPLEKIAYFLLRKEHRV